MVPCTLDIWVNSLSIGCVRRHKSENPMASTNSARPVISDPDVVCGGGPCLVSGLYGAGNLRLSSYSVTMELKSPPTICLCCVSARIHADSCRKYVLGGEFGEYTLVRRIFSLAVLTNRDILLP